MDFHQLKIFSAVYRLKSFTGASKELNISQPTISEHVKNLEKELACQLFDRLGRSIIPTAEGELLFPRAQQLLDSLSRLKDDLASSSDKLRGEIALGASTIPGTYIIPAMVVDFTRQHPEVIFEVIIDDTARIIDRVLAHELFCGIVGAKQSSDKLQYIPFLRDEMVIVTSNGFWSEDCVEPECLYELPFLQREKGSGTRKCMADRFRSKGLPIDRLNIVATLGSTAAVKEAAIQGLGITVLSRLAVQDELSRGKLREIKIKGLTMGRDFYLVHHKLRTLPSHYQAFCQHIQNLSPLPTR
jgi:DNA-binding transcriptional LysR family regulator